MTPTHFEPRDDREGQHSLIVSEASASGPPAPGGPAPAEAPPPGPEDRPIAPKTVRKGRSGCWSMGFYLLWHTLVWFVRHWKFTLMLLLLAAAAWGYHHVRQQTAAGMPLLAVEHNTAIERTPEEIRVLRDIGQWEFLAVETEELVEDHRRGVLSDDHLVRVYRGTLRLGLDLSKAGDDWFSVDGKTAILRLPDVGLLDESFIDEAHTTSFYETGTWGAEDRQRLYDRAREAMKARALSEDNRAMARRNATEQFRKIFTALGYEDVVVTFKGVQEK